MHLRAIHVCMYVVCMCMCICLIMYDDRVYGHILLVCNLLLKKATRSNREKSDGSSR